MPHDADRLALLAAIDTDLEDVEQALARLDDGTYASCEVCGAPLDGEQLAADPLGRRCGSHRSA